MNPRDIMTDAIHNFHPQYQQYTQYSSAGNRHKFDENQGESCADDSVATSATHAARAVATTAASVASNAATAAKSAIQPKQAKVTNNEKTLLLSSDDEFQ